MGVSVIIPIFNRSSTILSASKSVLAEKEVSELILIDDCSSDDLASVVEIIKAHCVSRHVNFVFHQNLFNMGPSYSRNKGVDLSANEIIAFHDADDIWMQGKLNYQLKMLTSQNDLVIGNMTTQFSNSRRSISQSKHLGLPATITKVLDGKFSTSTPTMLLFRSKFLAINGFDTSLLLREDHDFFIRHLKSGGAIKCGSKSVATRIYDGKNYSQSLNVFRRYRAELRFLIKHKKDTNFDSERVELISRLVRLNSDLSIRGTLIALKKIGLLKLLKVKLRSIASYSMRQLR